jgi:hypothetical protein
MYYFGMKVTNKNLIEEEITKRLISGNASVHNLLYKNVKFRIQNT